MAHPLEGLSLREIAALPGVKDLPLMVRGQFAIALRAEAAGDLEKAESALCKAVEAELKA